MFIFKVRLTESKLLLTILIDDNQGDKFILLAEGLQKQYPDQCYTIFSGLDILENKGKFEVID